jgi:hydroxypyruvate reductase
VGVFAVGKAAAGMLAGTDDRFGPGLVVLPHGYRAPAERGAEVLFASHPDPDSSSTAAARRAIRFFEGFGADDAILCLVSGGTSALLCLPRRGVTLAEKKRTVRRVARSGASIVELNSVRTSLSAVKGGRLGRRTRARLVSLAISDVPGDRPQVIGSGPTIRGSRRDVVLVIATNALGLAAAESRARELGLTPVRRRPRLTDEASAAGAMLARAAGKLAPGSALLAGGETTVSLGDASGRGGRCLELAVGAWEGLERAGGISLLAAGSDGRDGSSRAAGAFADSESRARAERAGLDGRKALRTHDTEPLLETLGDLFVTGPTGTNVADWAFALRQGDRT